MRYLEDVLFLLYPEPCVICAQLDPRIHQHLCSTCRLEITQVCTWPPRRPEKIPDGCASIGFAGFYEGKLQELIKKFKFAGKRELAQPLAELFLTLPHPDWKWHELSGLVPVPMTFRHFIERGFDQTLLLSLSLQRLLRKTLHLEIPVLVNLLAESERQSHQVGRNRARRLENISERFFVRRRISHQALQNVLLVDDVSTTGATLQACSSSLRETFPELQIHAFVLAQTPLLEKIQVL